MEVSVVSLLKLGHYKQKSSVLNWEWGVRRRGRLPGRKGLT